MPLINNKKKEADDEKIKTFHSLGPSDLGRSALDKWNNIEKSEKNFSYCFDMIHQSLRFLAWGKKKQVLLPLIHQPSNRPPKLTISGWKSQLAQLFFPTTYETTFCSFLKMEKSLNYTTKTTFLLENKR